MTEEQESLVEEFLEYYKAHGRFPSLEAAGSKTRTRIGRHFKSYRQLKTEVRHIVLQNRRRQKEERLPCGISRDVWNYCSHGAQCECSWHCPAWENFKKRHNGRV